MRENRIKIGGMMCSHCIKRVTRILEKFEGIKNINVNLDTSFATFESDREIEISAIKKALEEEGYYIQK